MHFLHSVSIAWARVRQAARREFLRDPDVILFERRGDASALTRSETGYGR